MKNLTLRDRAGRAIAECRRIALMSEEPGSTTRRYLTAPTREVHALLRGRMEALGMTVHLDAAGNLRGLWQPQNSRGKQLLIGSHIDTVPNAGAFDGVLGVTLALEWVEIAQELQFPFDIEIVAFSEEEGVRFNVPYIGSRAVAGRFDPALLSLKDNAGVTVEDAIRAFGLDPTQMSEAELDAGTIGYVEPHIEQGPALDAEGLSVAAVTAIVGQTRMSLTFTGQSNHAGTTPMHLRHDALTAAAEWIAAVESLAQRTEGLVATVGKIENEPNVGNVVPGSVRVSLDVRHAYDSERKAAVTTLLEQAEAITARRGLTLETKQLSDQPAAPMDEQLTGFLAEAIEAGGFPLRRMPSGAGHDAMVLAARVPTAMLFVRSPGGISHHPDESVLEEDVEASLNVARRFLERLAAEVR
jgi:allantoate deiminase